MQLLIWNYSKQNKEIGGGIATGKVKSDSQRDIKSRIKSQSQKLEESNKEDSESSFESGDEDIDAKMIPVKKSNRFNMLNENVMHMLIAR